MKYRLLVGVVAVVLTLLFVAMFGSMSARDKASTEYDAAHPAEVPEKLDTEKFNGAESLRETSSIDDRMRARKGPRHRVVEPDVKSSDVEDAGQAEDKNATQLQKKDSWVDPVNQRVLGEPTWMARPSKEMAKRVESVLAEKRDNPEDRRLVNLDRRSAIDAVGALVTSCVEAMRERNPGAYGRVSVVFDFETSGELGTVTKGRVGRVWKLNDDPEFVPCVEADLQGMTFEARTDSARVTVEYPYFFEDM